MIDLFLEQRKKRHVRGLNIVPVLDMLTTVIFFLLMSTGFMEYTKLTLPQSSVVSVNAQDAPPPLSPKFLITRSSGGNLLLKLLWQGEHPGEKHKMVPEIPTSEKNPALLEASRELASELSKANSSEKTLHVGLGAQIPYQNLITVMDGVRGAFPDIVLLSYHETEALQRATASSPEESER